MHVLGMKGYDSERLVEVKKHTREGERAEDGRGLQSRIPSPNPMSVLQGASAEVVRQGRSITEVWGLFRQQGSSSIIMINAFSVSPVF
jgi:hypothetical protein